MKAWLRLLTTFRRVAFSRLTGLPDPGGRAEIGEQRKSNDGEKLAVEALPMNLDDYIRRSNLIFQEMADREASAREQKLLARLYALGVDVEDLRKVLRAEGRRRGKTDAQSHRWANRVLRRLRALLEEE